MVCYLLSGNAALLVLCTKKGSRDDPSHYRPVSLTSVLCHVLENIIAEKLTNHLFKYNLLSTNQFGFMPNRSACSQLLIALNKWYKSFDDANDIDIIYTDILKAFDTVSHPKLISVLKSYGVCCNVLNWITSFISLGNNVCVLIIHFLLFVTLLVVFLKGVSWDHYCLLFTLII